MQACDTVVNNTISLENNGSGKQAKFGIYLILYTHTLIQDSYFTYLKENSGKQAIFGI